MCSLTSMINHVYACVILKVGLAGLLTEAIRNRAGTHTFYSQTSYWREAEARCATQPSRHGSDVAAAPAAPLLAACERAKCALGRGEPHTDVVVRRSLHGSLVQVRDWVTIILAQPIPPFNV